MGKDGVMISLGHWREVKREQLHQEFEFRSSITFHVKMNIILSTCPSFCFIWFSLCGPLGRQSPLYVTQCEYLIAVLTSGFSLKSDKQQVASALRDPSKYSNKFLRDTGQDRLNSSFLLSLSLFYLLWFFTLVRSGGFYWKLSDCKSL